MKTRLGKVKTDLAARGFTPTVVTDFEIYCMTRFAFSIDEIVLIVMDVDAGFTLAEAIMANTQTEQAR